MPSTNPDIKDTRTAAKTTVKPKSKWTFGNVVLTIVTLGVYGIYLCCKKDPEEQIQPVQQQPVQPQDTKPITIPPPVVIQPSENKDKEKIWQSITVKLIPLTSAVSDALKSPTCDLSATNQKFKELFDRCASHPILKSIVANHPIADGSPLDNLTQQLNFLEATLEIVKLQLSLQNGGGSTTLETTSLLGLHAELPKLVESYKQLRAKLIFQQHKNDLDAQLVKPKNALAVVTKKLQDTKSSAPTQGKTTVSEIQDTKPYDRDQLPPLTTDNDPKLFLEQRGKDLEALQKTVNSLLVATGETSVPEFKAEKIADTPDAEKNYLANIKTVHQETLAALLKLKSNPACHAIPGEVDALYASYSPVLSQIEEGVKTAKEFRQAEVMNMINLNPALKAFHIEIMTSFDCLITAAKGGRSKMLTTEKCKEEDYTTYVTGALKQLKFIPGMETACSFLDNIGAYVGGVLKEARFNNILNWSNQITNPTWREQFAMLLTLAKREEIATMVKDAQNAAEKPRLEKMLKDMREQQTVQGDKCKNLAKISTQAQLNLSNATKGTIHYKNYVKKNEQSLDKIAKSLINQARKNQPLKAIWANLSGNNQLNLTSDVNWTRLKSKKIQDELLEFKRLTLEKANLSKGMLDIVEKDSKLRPLKVIADAAEKQSYLADQNLLNRAQEIETVTRKLSALNEYKAKSPDTGMATKIKDFFTSLSGKAKEFKDSFDAAIAHKGGIEHENPGDILETTVGRGLGLECFTRSVDTMTKGFLRPGEDNGTAVVRLIENMNSDEQQRSDLAKVSVSDLEEYYLFNRKTKESSPYQTQGPIFENHLNCNHFDYKSKESTEDKKVSRRRDSNSFLNGVQRFDSSDSTELHSDNKAKDSKRKRSLSTASTNSTNGTRSRSPSTASTNSTSTNSTSSFLEDKHRRDSFDSLASTPPSTPPSRVGIDSTLQAS